MENVRHTSLKRWFGMACLATCCASLALAATSPATATFGPFEIVSELRNSTSGGLFSATGNRATSVASTRFTVKYKAELVKVQNTNYVFGTKAREDDERTTTRFWGIARLVNAPRPTLLVQTTEVWLLTEQDGHLISQSVHSSDAGCQWLDGDQGQPTSTGAIRTGKADIDADSELKQGRWLRVGPSVLDVQTLRQYTVPTSSVAVAAVPFSGLQSGQRAVAFSPGQTQFVTVGTGWDSADTTRPVPALVVSDIARGTLYGVKLSRKAQHYESEEDVNRAWFEHYFHWTRDANGVEQLVAHSDARPLPWIGRFSEGSFKTVEYRLQPARPEMVPALAKFIAERMSAAPAPDFYGTNKVFHGTTFSVAGCTGIVRVTYSTRERSGQGHAGVYASGATPTAQTPADCAAAVRRIGEAFDAELKSGKHQELFFSE